MALDSRKIMLLKEIMFGASRMLLIYYHEIDIITIAEWLLLLLRMDNTCNAIFKKQNEK